MAAPVDLAPAPFAAELRTRMLRFPFRKALRIAALTSLVAGIVLALFALGLLSPVPPAAAGASGNHLVNYNTGSTTTVTDTGILALAASIAIAGGLIGTGMAQSGIGASGMGIIAERPEKFGQVLVFFVIPETLWILGFVLGIVLLLGIL